MDRVAFGGRPHIGLQALAIDHIDRRGEQAGDDGVSVDAGIVAAKHVRGGCAWLGQR
jgi:hypothetical protein